MSSKFQRSNSAGWLMAGPAGLLIAGFVILPFFFAIALSFTNQRLISPNPTEFTGLANYRQLLGMGTLVVEPLLDDAGAVVMKDGAPDYPAVRSFTRNNPDYAHLQGMREWTSFSWGDSRVYILARDVVFLTAIINTFIFVIVVAPHAGWSGAGPRPSDQPAAARHQRVPRDLFHAGCRLDRRRLAAVAVHL